MSPRESAYAALGLRPGANRAEVDLAYRKLIKIHHPDRTGGDGGRAAEINRAYSLLRRQGLASGPQSHWVPARVRPAPRRARSSRFPWFVTCALLGALGGVAVAGDRGWFDSGSLQVNWPDRPVPTAQLSRLASFDEPLHGSVIDSAIDEAVRFHAAKDLSGAAAYSRHCQNRLRRQPSLVWLDACAAFDEATVTLGEDDVLSRTEDFNGPAVIARSMAAARMVSDDAIAGDSRLHQIRLRVELRLLPAMDALASGAGQSPDSAVAGGPVRPSGF